MFSVETTGIALGLSLALGVFSLKTAVGEFYLCALPYSRTKKNVLLLTAWTMYGALFLLSFFALDRMDSFHAAENSLVFLESGVALHLLLCVGLLLWGIRLLCRVEKPDSADSKGWLLLTIPCPVCAASVFLVCAFSAMLFPRSMDLLRWGIPVFFLSSNLLFLLLLRIAGKILRLRPLALTGRAMILIALYFLLILLIAPRFQDAERLYAVARASGPDLLFTRSFAGITAFSGIAVLSGFIWNCIHG